MLAMIFALPALLLATSRAHQTLCDPEIAVVTTSPDKGSITATIVHNDEIVTSKIKIRESGYADSIAYLQGDLYIAFDSSDPQTLGQIEGIFSWRAGRQVRTIASHPPTGTHPQLASTTLAASGELLYYLTSDGVYCFDPVTQTSALATPYPPGESSASVKYILWNTVDSLLYLQSNKRLYTWDPATDDSCVVACSKGSEDLGIAAISSSHVAIECEHNDIEIMATTYTPAVIDLLSQILLDSATVPFLSGSGDCADIYAGIETHPIIVRTTIKKDKISDLDVLPIGPSPILGLMPRHLFENN